jgi:hypothetical protein
MTVSLPFPYLQFTYYAGQLSVGARNHSAKTPLTAAYHLPLPNLYAKSGRSCQSDTKNIEKAIDQFWFTKFYYSFAWLGCNLMKDIFPGENFYDSLMSWKRCDPDYMVEKIDWKAECPPIHLWTFARRVYVYGDSAGPYVDSEAYNVNILTDTAPLLYPPGTDFLDVTSAPHQEAY